MDNLVDNIEDKFITLFPSYYYAFHRYQTLLPIMPFPSRPSLATDNYREFTQP